MESAGNGAVDDARQARGLLGGVIEDEIQLRGVPQSQPPPDLAPQEAGGPREAALHPSLGGADMNGA